MCCGSRSGRGRGRDPADRGPARAVRLLEPEVKGAMVEETMLGVLRAMVAFQTEHLQHRTVKPRVKMRKKTELKREEEMQRNAALI